MLSLDEREAASARIAANFFRDFDLASIRILHCFIAIERFNEVDTRPIVQRIWSEFPQVLTVVPRINHETEEFESLKYGPSIDLVAKKGQIEEPFHNERVEP